MQKKVTSEILQQLRSAMREPKLVVNPLDALIVSTWDAHQVWHIQTMQLACTSEGKMYLLI